MNSESQKLVPTRNRSHLEPQKFVPANHKKSLIRKIKLPQNFHATRYKDAVQFRTVVLAVEIDELAQLRKSVNMAQKKRNSV